MPLGKHLTQCWMLHIKHRPHSSMAAETSFLKCLLLLLLISPRILQSRAGTPEATPWPHQFHSILYVNYSGAISLIDLWYDWPKGRNFNIIQNQLGTSFYRGCRSAHFKVGILRPNWLHGTNYLGQERVDGFLCNVWEKAEFLWYYEDVVTKRPVHWVFYTGRSAHVMTFEVGAMLEDSKWQAPVYCFHGRGEEENPEPQSEIAKVSQESLMLKGNITRSHGVLM